MRSALLERMDLHGDGNVAAAIRDLEVNGMTLPARSTLYAWAQTWQAARDADETPAWSLRTDRTGHPEIVMVAIAGLSAVSGRERRVTSAEADWIVRVGVALPNSTQDGFVLYRWARRFLETELAGDDTTYDEVWAALRYAGDGRYEEQFMGTVRALMDKEAGSNQEED